MAKKIPPHMIRRLAIVIGRFELQPELDKIVEKKGTWFIVPFALPTVIDEDGGELEYHIPVDHLFRVAQDGNANRDDYLLPRALNGTYVPNGDESWLVW